MSQIVTVIDGCRDCGCTDEDCYDCYHKTGDLCRWVEEDLCSACAPRVEKLEQEISEALSEAFQDGVEWACNQVLMLLRAQATPEPAAVLPASCWASRPTLDYERKQ